MILSTIQRSSTRQLLRRTIGSTSSPYAILGVSPTSSMETVQKAFVQLALKHHPDTAKGAAATSFVQIRQAFERIRTEKLGSKDKGYCDNRLVDMDGSEEEFLDWFHKQSGVRLTSAQRRELVHLYRSRNPNGYYGGHSWDLARRLVMEQDAYLKRASSRTFNGCEFRKTKTKTKRNSLRRKRKR